MTSRFHTIGPMARIKHDVIFRWSSPGGNTTWTSDNKCLVEFGRMRQQGWSLLPTVALLCVSTVCVHNLRMWNLEGVWFCREICFSLDGRALCHYSRDLAELIGFGTASSVHQVTMLLQISVRA